MRYMINKYLYKGFYITEVDNGVFDILDVNGDLVDGEIRGFDNAKQLIDSGIYN